jgi:hypothetical protein
MEKLLFLFALVISLTAAKAQVITKPLAAGDTVVNTATVTKVIDITGAYKGVVIQAKSTKISGTVAGTIKLQASIDGTLYTDVTSQTGSATDVASMQLLFYATAPLARYYRVTWTGTGTMSAVLSVKYLVNK